MRVLFSTSIVLFLALICSCDNSENVSDSVDIKQGLIDSYLEKYEDKNLLKEERVNNLNRAYALVDALPDSNYKIEKLQKISFKHFSQNNLDKYKDLNEKALIISKKINDSNNIAKSYGLLGIYYRDSKIDSAFKYFYEADKIYTAFDLNKSKDPKLYAYDHGRNLIDLAQLSRRVKDYSESEDLTIRAINKFQESGDYTYMPMSYNNLGIIAKYLERYEEAVNYYLQVIDFAKEIGKDTLYSTLSYNNIGTIYKSQGKYDEAIEYYNKALSFKDFLKKNPSRYARLLDNLTYAKFLSDKSNKDVLKMFERALTIRDSIGDDLGISTNSLHLAEYFKYNGKDSLAKAYAQRAAQISLQTNNNVELLDAYKLLSEISESDEAIGYAQSYIKLNDSLVREDRLFKDKFARIRFETKQKEAKISEISRENEFLVIAVLGLTALFLLVYIIFRQQQSNKELLFAQAQQESNEEIYRLLLNQQVKLEEGRQMEQHRMSEELHDGVLGRLFGVRLSLDGLNQRANDGFTEARNKYIDELKSIEKEIRLISHDLGTDTLTPDVAYIDVVESLISDLCDAHQMDFEFSNDENIDWEEIDDQKKVNLLRILQESLQNIFKHAKATKVKISFDYIDNNINLTVLDNGVGFKSNRVKRGIGLKNITNRVGQMSGVVDFISNQDRGTTVHVSVPV